MATTSPTTDETVRIQLAVLAVADRYVPRLTNQLLEALSRVPSEAEVDEAIGLVQVNKADDQVARALDRFFGGRLWLRPFDLQGLEQIGSNVYDVPSWQRLIDTFLRVMGGAASVGGLVGARFDLVNPLAVRTALEQGARLVREIADETRATIREIVARGLRTGATRAEVVADIRATVGLTRRQARAVLNYRDALRNPNVSGRGVQSAYRLSPRRVPDLPTSAEVDRLTRQYASRWRTFRAQTIARTETMRAANRGQVLNWQLAVQDGFLPTVTRKRWLVTPDDRLCEICAPMNGAEATLVDGFRSDTKGLPGQPQVPTEVLFVTEPPLHPRCRCTLVIWGVDLEAHDRAMDRISGLVR